MSNAKVTEVSVKWVARRGGHSVCKVAIKYEDGSQRTSEHASMSDAMTWAINATVIVGGV